MKRKIALLLALFLCLSMLGCEKDPSESDGFKDSDVADTDHGDTTQTDPTNENAATATPISRPDFQMSNNPIDFTVTIDGLVYQFPCDIEVFLNDGWIPKSGYVLEDDYEVSSGETCGVVMYRGSAENKVTVWAYYPETGKYSSGIAYRLCSEADSTVDVELAGGIKLTADLTPQDIFEVFGSDYTYSKFDGDRYVYRLEGKGLYIFTFVDDSLTYWEFRLYDEAIA